MLRLTAKSLVATLLLPGCATLHVGSAAPPADARLAAVAFLEGRWSRVDGTARTEEQWLRPLGGTMVGLGRTTDGPKTVFFEYLRLEADAAGLVYLASPKGRFPPTPFRLVEQGPGRAVFENPEHDFPKRISYQREGDRLTARVEGGGPAETWIFAREAP